jgi:ubiquinone/menaquinone biosynthesis C-methylase UbiE
MNRTPGQAAWMADVAPVERPLARARATYDRVAGLYDLAENPFEYRARRCGLRLLAARPGERVLEIGPGTGHALAALAGDAGPSGQVIGVDLSARMLGRARRRVTRAGYAARVALIQGDAHRLPVAAGAFDAVFMSFVLELIDTRRIPQVLGECRRVLHPGGRLGVVCLQLSQPPPPMTRLYLAARRHLPDLLDCRPIPLSGLLTDAGWYLQAHQQLSVAGLPATAAVATPAPQRLHQRTASLTPAGPALAAAPAPDAGLGQYFRPVPDTATTQIPAARGVPRLVHTLTGHLGGYVGGVAFSPGGRLLASGNDETVWLWDPATGAEQRVLTGHLGRYVTCVAFSPDGRLLASGGADRKVRLWDPATGHEQRTLTVPGGYVSGVAFSPDGRLLAAAGDQGTVRLWDPATGAEQRVLTGHLGRYVTCVAFSPDGRLLASGGADRKVRLWDPATGHEQRTLSGYTSRVGGYVRGVAFSPDGRLLASCGLDTKVRLWDPATGAEQYALSGHTGDVLGVAFSPGGRLLASCGEQGTVRVWDLTPGR